MRKLLLIMVLLLLPSIVSASDFSIHWNANHESDLAGYTIHYGIESGVYTTSLPVGNVLTYILSLDAGTYFIVVSAEDMSGNSSDYSYEIKLLVRVSAPTGLGME